MTIVAPLLLSVLTFGRVSDDQSALQGTWKVTALVENGKSLSQKEIALEHCGDGGLVVEANTARLPPPGLFDRRKMVYVLTPTTNPKPIARAGGKRVNRRGIIGRARV